MNSLKCWLTYRRNGLYLITAFQPEIVRVYGTDHTDAYVVPGDPIGYNNVMPEFVDSIFDDRSDQICKPVKTVMYGRQAVDRATHYVYNDEYDNLFSIVYNFAVMARHVCSWFIDTMFNIKSITQSYELVEFWGENR